MVTPERICAGFPTSGARPRLFVTKFYGATRGRGEAVLGFDRLEHSSRVW